MANEISIEYLDTSYNDKHQIISLLDQKANIILGIVGIILSIIFPALSSLGISFIEIIIFSSFLILSGLSALAVLFPRDKKSMEGNSLLYFKQAAQVNEKKVLKLLGNNKKAMYEDYVINIKALSQIVERKIKFLRMGYIFLALGIILKIIFEIGIGRIIA